MGFGKCLENELLNQTVTVKKISRKYAYKEKKEKLIETKKYMGIKTYQRVPSQPPTQPVESRL